MNKKEFLESSSVMNFIDWISHILDQPGSFLHAYQIKKPKKSWQCTSLYSAYENYSWSFKTTDPESGKLLTGSSFNDNLLVLMKLSDGLKQSISQEDHINCRNHCYSILKWGGVYNKNNLKIDAYGDGICNYLANVREIFTNNKSSLESNNNQIIMNSGFTKIYSLCIDDFIIYDGRVGAALCLLVRKFCEDTRLDNAPVELAFAWAKGRETTYMSSSKNKRNPSSEKYQFPELLNNPRRHLENNIRANWLIAEILRKTESRFNGLDTDIQMRAFESALFMIGYQVR